MMIDGQKPKQSDKRQTLTEQIANATRLKPQQLPAYFAIVECSAKAHVERTKIKKRFHCGESNPDLLCERQV